MKKEIRKTKVCVYLSNEAHTKLKSAATLNSMSVSEYLEEMIINAQLNNIELEKDKMDKVSERKKVLITMDKNVWFEFKAKVMLKGISVNSVLEQLIMSNTKITEIIEGIRTVKLSDIIVDTPITVRDNIPSGKGFSFLMKSMQSIGLINPITLNENLKLIAGRRRYLAARQLGWKTILANIIITKEDPLLEKNIRIQENIQRKDLEDIELAKLISEYHELSKQKALLEKNK